jgi:hypothetical protein
MYNLFKKLGMKNEERTELKKVIILIFILTLLFTGCQMGVDKIYYPTSNASNADSGTTSETVNSNGTITQTVSKIQVQVDSNFDENAVPSAFVSSKPATTSSAPSYNRDEVLVFDDPVLEKIIRENMYIPKSGGNITVGDWVDYKFDSIRIFFNVETGKSSVEQVGYSYVNKIVTPRKTYDLITSFAVFAKMPGLKKIEISFYQVSPEFSGSFSADLSPIFSAKQVETFSFLGTYNLNIALKGVDKISTNTQLKELKLSNCGLISLPSFKALKNLSVVDVGSNKLNSGNQLLDLNAAVIKQIKYSNNPTVSDNTNLYNSLVQKFGKDKIVN